MIKKIVIYPLDKVTRMLTLLRSTSFLGSEAKVIAEISDIIASGEPLHQEINNQSDAVPQHPESDKLENTDENRLNPTEVIM